MAVLPTCLVQKYKEGFLLAFNLGIGIYSVELPLIKGALHGLLRPVQALVIMIMVLLV